jgi:Sec-independent protein secretion pathway component TatC
MSTKSEMSFWDHLEVLRWMLIRVLAVWTVCMLLGFVFVPYLFEQVVMAPCRDDFFLYQLIKQTAARSWIVPDFMETSFHVEVVNIRLASQFFIHMTLSCWLALLVTFPSEISMSRNYPYKNQATAGWLSTGSIHTYKESAVSWETPDHNRQNNPERT